MGPGQEVLLLRWGGRRGLILISIFYIDLLPLFFWFLSRAGKWNDLVGRAGWNSVINHYFEILNRNGRFFEGVFAVASV